MCAMNQAMSTPMTETGRPALAPPTGTTLPAVGRFPRLLLWLFVGWVGVQIGGGIYEKRVTIPLWATDPTPQELPRRLEESGMRSAGVRFWAFVSPAVALLSVLNLIAAWRSRGPARPWWLGASLAMLLVSISTYGYFVPTMITKIWTVGDQSAEELARTVRTWTTISPIRSIISVPAWFAAIKALTLLPAGEKGRKHQ